LITPTAASVSLSVARDLREKYGLISDYQAVCARILNAASFFFTTPRHATPRQSHR